MNACLYVGCHDNEWIWEIFPGKSPAEMPIAGKSWARHAVDLCSLLKIDSIFVADCFFYPDLPRRLGDGAYWSTKIQYLPCTDAPDPEQLFEQDGLTFPDDELLIFWGQVLPDIPEIQTLCDDLEPAVKLPDGTLPSGIYLLRQKTLSHCRCPLHRMNDPKSYFELNMRLLNHPGIYNLPGFSDEKNFCIGADVITMMNGELKPPLIIQDHSAIGRGVVLDGDVIIGGHVLIDDHSYLKRAVILNNTYIGRKMHIEDKIVAERTVIDIKTGVHLELDDEFLAGRAGKKRIDRYTAAEFVIALFLLIALFPAWLPGLLFRKLLSRLPFFGCVFRIYPKLPYVLTGHANLVRDGLRDDSYVFRFSDQWLCVPDEHYREFADVFFCTHRSIRYALMAVGASLLKRMITLTEPNRDGTKKK